LVNKNADIIIIIIIIVITRQDASRERHRGGGTINMLVLYILFDLFSLTAEVSYKFLTEEVVSQSQIEAGEQE
jgi:hypothetical protein